MRRFASKRSVLRGAAVAAAVLLGTAGLSLAAAPAFAQPVAQSRYVATTGSDGAGTPNDCVTAATPCLTISHAIDEAAAGDTVKIAAGSYAEIVQVGKPLTITGAGQGATTITGPAETATPAVVVNAPSGDDPIDVTLEKLTVANPNGFGVIAETTVLTITDSSVSGNGLGGIFSVDGGVVHATGVTADDNGTLAASGSSGPYGSGVEVLGGTVTFDAGSIDRNAVGGLVVEEGSATITNSTLDANVGAGAVADFGSSALIVSHSTITDTEPFPTSRSGSPRYGGGVLVFEGEGAVVDTSTLAGNVGQGVLSLGSATTVTNSTITGTKNSVDPSLPSGAVSTVSEPVSFTTGGSTSKWLPGSVHTRLRPAAAAPGLSVTATILADNTAPDCAGAIVDGGYNLADTDACAFTTTGSINSGDAALKTLANNGGPTKTVLVSKTSDAVNKIPSGTAGCTTSGTDQRGNARLQGAACEIGAVELTETALAVTPSSLPHAVVGEAYHVALQASGGLGGPYTFAVAGGGLPAGLTLSSDGVISGTPTAAGSKTVTIAVDDPTNFEFTLVVDPASSLAATGVSAEAPFGVGAGALLIGFALLTVVALRRRAADDAD